MNYVTPVMADSYTKLYEYDENNRLSRETKQKYLIQNEDSLTTATDYTYYEYDSIGNLASKRVAEGTLAEEISVGMKVLKNCLLYTSNGSGRGMYNRSKTGLRTEPL